MNDHVLRGIGASAGVGAGRAFVLQQRRVPATYIDRAQKTPVDVDNQTERFKIGRRVALDYYQTLVTRVRECAGAEEAEIFEGHIEILGGEDMEEAVASALTERARTAEQAVLEFAEHTAAEFEAMESEYFRQRAFDIRDIGSRLAEAIYFGSIADPIALEPDTVVVAEELTPSATARLDTAHVAAIATAKGGRTAHAAILARSLSIPCVTGIANLLDRVANGHTLIVDGDAGTVEVFAQAARAASRLAEVTERVAQGAQARNRRAAWSASQPFQTADGRLYHMAANVSGAAEARSARALGAEGVGLLRSEFFFMRLTDFPSVEQQAAEYRAVCQAHAPHPVIVRLLDCGADKPLPYAPQAQEDNPFLGLRGIRYLQSNPEQFRAQVQAIAQVAREGHAIKLMVPMVIDPEEVHAVRSVLSPADAQALPIGIMVETPASVMTIEAFLPHAAFVSIGTNDLVQYTLAVDRGNARVAPLYREFHPAVIHAIDRVVDAAHRAGRPVGVCGDMASNPATALALLALGVDELSVSLGAIPEIKAALLHVRSTQLNRLAEQLRAAPDAESARAAATELIPAGPPPWEDAETRR